MKLAEAFLKLQNIFLAALFLLLVLTPIPMIPLMLGWSMLFSVSALERVVRQEHKDSSLQSGLLCLKILKG